MWNPSESETFQNFAWLWKNHPPDNRIHSIIFISKSGKNILTPENLKKVLFFIWFRIPVCHSQNKYNLLYKKPDGIYYFCRFKKML